MFTINPTPTFKLDVTIPPPPGRGTGGIGLTEEPTRPSCLTNKKEDEKAAADERRAQG